MSDAPSIQILVTPDFQGQLRKLAKRYRNIQSDLQPLFDDLESGNCPGDQISGTTYTVFKVRSFPSATPAKLLGLYPCNLMRSPDLVGWVEV
jgi:hypothetical protein